jgi:peptide/nickel transport system substrate-binding protein
LLLAGCGPCRAPTSDRVLILGTLYEPRTLDPAFADTAGDQEIARLVYRDLTEFDPSWSTVPSLAEALPAVRTSSDGTVRATWRLRETSWSDGRRITPNDVVFGHRVESDPRLGAKNHEVAQRVLAVRALDDRRFEVVWRARSIDLDAPRVHAVLPAHAYPRPEGADFAGLTEGRPSSGPFAVEAWARGQYLSLVPSPGWGGVKPSLDRIVFRFFGAEDGLVAALLAKEIDAAGEASGLSLEAARLLARDLGATHVVEERPSGGWLHLGVRLDDALLGDVRARRAVSRAIDRAALAKVVYSGGAVSSFGLFPSAHRGYVDPPEDATFDVAAARALLDGAGPRRSITLQYASGGASERAATFVASSLAAIGLEVELEGLHFRVLLERIERRAHAPLVLYLFRTAPTWDGRSVLHSKGSQNAGGYRDADVDRWLDEAERSEDRTVWAERVQAVNRRFMEALPLIPLAFRHSVSVRPAALAGWAPTGTRAPVTWNAENWRKPGESTGAP